MLDSKDYKVLITNHIKDLHEVAVCRTSHHNYDKSFQKELKARLVKLLELAGEHERVYDLEKHI